VTELRATLSASLLRGLETLLPVSGYLSLIYPVAFVRAVIHQLCKRPKPLQPPGFITESARPERLLRLTTYLNRTFEFIPDRLNTDKWTSRCRYRGIEPGRTAIEAGTPVIFAFAHFGPYELLRNWLRAVGVPVAMVAGGSVTSRTRLLRRKDQWAVSSDFQAAFHLDQLPDAVRNFKNGQPLAMAIDSSPKRHLKLPLPNDWTFEMATGTIRLARNHGALLFPCAIYNDGPWRFAVEVLPAVPVSLMSQDDESAGRDILDKLLPIFSQRPNQWHHQLLRQFIPPTTARN